MDPANCTNSFTVAYGYVDDKRNSSVNNILADGSVINGTAATSTVVVTVTAAATSSASCTVSGTPASSTGSPSCTDTSSSSSALTAGLGAGLGVGVPLLIALATSLFFLQKTRKENRALKSGGAHAPNHVATTEQQQVPKAAVFQNAGHPNGTPELGQQSSPSVPVYEAPGSDSRYGT